MADVIQLNHYILRCNKCGSNEFYIFLGSNNPRDYSHYECVGCGEVWPLEYLEDRKGE